jgi:SagB-type dehydrogenase family enzyme
VEAGQIVGLYHRLSSYGPELDFPAEPVEHPLVLQDFVANDVARWPPQYKRYGVGHRVPLPTDWSVGGPATRVLAGQDATASVHDLTGLARLLYLSAGVVRTGRRSASRVVLFRAAGSAGGRFPLELYVAARGISGLDDGVYWYDPLEHALLAIAAPPAMGATTLIVTGVPWRTGWRYSERGWRHLYWDAGTMLAQTLALAGPARLWTRFPDATVARLIGADGTHEFPIALVTLGDGQPAIEPSSAAVTGTIDDDPVEFPLVTFAQHAGDSDQLGGPWANPDPLDGSPPPSPDLDSVILRRGSTRLMDPTATVSGDVYSFSLAAATRGIEVPHFAAVHAVAGIEPGLYRWPEPQPMRSGNLREELLKVCWYQDLGRDAAFDVIGAVDLTAVTDRGYREAQLAVGIVEGRLHLAAYALGVGASGMTFLDTEIEPLLGAQLAGLLITCVGVPTYRNTTGGRPRQPVEVITPAAPRRYPPRQPNSPEPRRPYQAPERGGMTLPLRGG